MSNERRNEIRRVARELGYERLRPGQLEAVSAILDGRDVLAVMASGYGKSAIYQIAGLLIDGPTLVVSPLIALQRDQVETIEEELPGEAVRVASDLSDTRRAEILEETGEGRHEFVFLAPEQLANENVLNSLVEAKPSLLVVDEAHCISEWGHDFRPDYLRLGAFAERLGSPALLALTATAAPPVRAEIVRRLRMRDPETIVRGFDRPEIRLWVERHNQAGDKRRAIREAVAAATPPGIVYVATRAGSEELAAQLRAADVDAAAYHAGMATTERDGLQERFMDDELDVIVATTAFGMGIDKPNVRFVFHAEISESLDSYYQEIGRAGRDGRAAEARLFFRPEDQGIRRFFTSGGHVDVDEIGKVAREVHGRLGAVDPETLGDELDLSQTKLLAAVNRLEEAGAVRLRADGLVESVGGRPPSPEVIAEAAEADRDRKLFERSRIEMMRGYAEHDGCRREFLLSYFGESFEPPCGNCDNCLSGLVEASDESGRPFAIGSCVEHPEWGAGEVQRYDAGTVIVLFDAVGYKTLGLDLVAERELLRPAG